MPDSDEHRLVNVLARRRPRIRNTPNSARPRVLALIDAGIACANRPFFSVSHATLLDLCKVHSTCWEDPTHRQRCALRAGRTWCWYGRINGILRVGRSRDAALRSAYSQESGGLERTQGSVSSCVVHTSLFTCSPLAQNADGLRQYHDDAIPLVYAPLPPDFDDEYDENEDETEEDIPSHSSGVNFAENMDVDLPLPLDRNTIGWWPGQSTYRLATPPPLPISPVSNPSSPTRKRPRLLKWPAPDHIPDFFPPFPDDRNSIDQHPAPPSPDMPPVQLPPTKIEKPPSPVPQPALASTSAPDYLTRVPYDQSTLSATPEWHLPQISPHSQSSSQTKATRTSIPQTEPSFIAAYHHILTHPPPPSANFANPSRHKVAMALLARTQTASRWDPPDTLYSSVTPCLPRVAAVSPTFPIQIATGPPGSLDAKVEEPRYPVIPGKCVVAQERFSPSINQQASRIPELARMVLSVSLPLSHCLFLRPLAKLTPFAASDICPFADQPFGASFRAHEQRPKTRLRNRIARAVELVARHTLADACPARCIGQSERRRCRQRHCQ